MPCVRSRSNLARGAGFRISITSIYSSSLTSISMRLQRQLRHRTLPEHIRQNDGVMHPPAEPVLMNLQVLFRECEFRLKRYELFARQDGEPENARQFLDLDLAKLLLGVLRRFFVDQLAGAVVEGGADDDQWNKRMQ